MGTIAGAFSEIRLRATLIAVGLKGAISQSRGELSLVIVKKNTSEMEVTSPHKLPHCLGAVPRNDISIFSRFHFRPPMY